MEQVFLKGMFFNFTFHPLFIDLITDYIICMQKFIYHLTGKYLAAVWNLPFLEIFKKSFKNFLLVDHINKCTVV
jgi:hypothetical protein